MVNMHSVRIQIIAVFSLGRDLSCRSKRSSCSVRFAPLSVSSDRSISFLLLLFESFCGSSLPSWGGCDWFGERRTLWPKVGNKMSESSVWLDGKNTTISLHIYLATTISSQLRCDFPSITRLCQSGACRYCWGFLLATWMWDVAGTKYDVFVSTLWVVFSFLDAMAEVFTTIS